MERFLSTSMFFCSSIYIETALNSREECNEFADLLFWIPHYESFIFLSRDSLSSATRLLDLRILFKFMFIRLIHSAPFLRFTFFFTHIFLIYFSNSWWCRWSAKTRNFIFIFHFSIVIRDEWLWKAANINDKDNSAAVYVVSTLKVHNPLFSVGKLLRNKLMQRFYWSIQSKW